MKLPRPSEQLAGCVWLPRILAKTRLLRRGTLPEDYAARFCHPQGVDGAFVSHFGLSRDDIVYAAAMSDDKASEWFSSRTSAERVEQWNQIAVNLGRPGYPMAERFSVAVSTTYKNVASRGLTTVFEVLEADEQDA